MRRLEDARLLTGAGRLPNSAEAHAFPSGCQVCEVEIDPDTGAVRLARLVAVDDIGTVLNPSASKAGCTGESRRASAKR